MTDEWSHYGDDWNDDIRTKFKDFIQEHDVNSLSGQWVQILDLPDARISLGVSREGNWLKFPRGLSRMIKMSDTAPFQATRKR